MLRSFSENNFLMIAALTALSDIMHTVTVLPCAARLRCQEHCSVEKHAKSMKYFLAFS